MNQQRALNSDPALCAICQGTGWARITRNGVDGVTRCECRKAERPGRLMESARIPSRYAHCDLSNFVILPPHTTRTIEKARLDAEKFVEEYPSPQPFGLLFMGPQGVGKTHLAVGIIKQLMTTKAVPCLFWAFPELLKEIQLSYNPIAQASELSLLAPVLETEILVLDELGAQRPSSWVRDTVGYILNHRYNENKVTILTTNYIDTEERSSRAVAPDSLTDRIGAPMRSRLYEMCKTVKMEGNDFRRENLAKARS